MVRLLAGIVLCVILGALAQAQESASETFSCEESFGPGFTPGEVPYSCCYPGTVPVPGENRCASPGSADAAPQKQLQPVPPPSSGQGQQCIATGQVCVLNGTPCCSGSCSGNFPNTYCQ